jgi:hypothetical protein
MELITPEIRARLLANGAMPDGADHFPVVKLFYPCGAATWLITEMLPDDPSLMFGLADLGHPEIGYISLSELQAFRGRFNVGIERDLHFVARFPLSVYADAARDCGRITESAEVLSRFARRRGLEAAPVESTPPATIPGGGQQ